MKNGKNLSKYTKKIVPILRKNSVIMAGIFGSFVRGEETKNSDLDILVKFGDKRSLLDLVRLERTLKKELGIKVDLLTYNSLNPLLKQRILKEEVRII